MLKEPPGAMLYVAELIPVLRRLELEESGRLLSAVLEYRSNGSLPDLDNYPKVAVAWDFIKPKLDADRLDYAERQLKGLYGVYKRENSDGASFEQWLMEKYVPMEGADDPLLETYLTVKLSVSLTKSLSKTVSQTVSQTLAQTQEVAVKEKETGLQRGKGEGNVLDTDAWFESFKK